MSRPPFVLHATPPLQGLPASDRESIYLAGLLALACPGQWGIVTADWSENGGKIPYITHRGHHIRPRHLSSISNFSDPDAFLEVKQKADCEVWKAYIEGTLIDLVYHTLYSLPSNHPILARAQTAEAGYLERNYVSQRIKGIHKARLQHIGLWGLGGLDEGEATEEDRKRLEEAFIIGPAGTQAPRAWAGFRSGRELEKRRRLWGEEELSTRIKAALDPVVRRLGDGPYFFGARPTTLDIALFATLTLILTPTWPNALFSNHLHAYYPSLVAHHNRTVSTLFGSYDTLPRIPRPPRSTILESVMGWWRGDTPAEMEEDEKTQSKKKTDKEKAFERGRWLWFAGAGIAMVGYVLASGLVRFEIGGGDEDEDFEEEIDEFEIVEEAEEDEDEDEDEDGSPLDPRGEVETMGDAEAIAGEGSGDSPLAAFTEGAEGQESSTVVP